jgi:hypothetical protein
MKSQVISTRWRLLRWPMAIGAWSVLALIGLAGMSNAAAPTTATLHLTRDVSGVVQIVNVDGSKFCLLDDRTQDQFCSVVWQPASVGRLQVGEHVSGTVALLPIGPSSSEEIFVLTDPRPSP